MAYCGNGREALCGNSCEAHGRTEIEPYSGSSGDYEWLEHKAACVGHDVLLQLLVFRILILVKGDGERGEGEPAAVFKRKSPLQSLQIRRREIETDSGQTVASTSTASFRATEQLRLESRQQKPSRMKSCWAAEAGCA